jgi:hypothetical protein
MDSSKPKMIKKNSLTPLLWITAGVFIVVLVSDLLDKKKEK